MGDFNSKSLTISLLLVVIALFAGMFLGRYSSNPKTAQVANQTPEQNPQKNTIFDIQTANIQGQVTKVQGSNLTIRNQKGQTADFPASSKFVVYKYKTGATQASASAGLNSVAIGQKANISLENINGKYQVVSVSYLPPPPSSK